MHIIIAGSRTFDDYELLASTMDHLTQNLSEVVVVSGCARGADQLGECWAKERGHAIKKFPARWNELGKRAGFIRNEEMARASEAAVVFWNGTSRGSQHMIDTAFRLGLRVKVVRC